MSARTELKAALVAALPGYRVTGARGIQEPAQGPSVGVWQSRVVRRPEWQKAHAQVELEVWVTVPQEDPDRADDALDDALDDLISALNPINWCDWTLAERGVLSTAIHGYQVTVVAVAEIGD